MSGTGIVISRLLPHVFYLEHLARRAFPENVPRGTSSPKCLPTFHVERSCGKMGILLLQLVYAAMKCLCWFAALKSVIANAQRVGLFCKRLSDSLNH